jgi:outer membrane protein OmpA-like peptidoglycan-associated protein
MRCKPYRQILLYLLSFYVICFADAPLSNISGAFTDVGYGARPMGMGGAFTAICDDPNAAYWNPAGLLKVKWPGISIMYSKMWNLIPFYYSTLSFNLSNEHALGFAMNYNGDDLYREFEPMVSYCYRMGQILGNPFSKLYLGISAMYRYADYGNNKDGVDGQVYGYAHGYGYNIGLLWQINNRYSIAMVYRDFLDYLKWKVKSDYFNYRRFYNEDIPVNLTIGMSAKVGGNVIIGMDIQKSLRIDTNDRIAFGMEKELFRFLIPRIGISQNILSLKEEQDRHITLGIGIAPEFAESSVGFAFNFAYCISELSPTLRFGVDFLWGIKHIKPLPPRVAISVIPDTIKIGEQAELKWLARGASLITIEPDIGSVDSVGNILIEPENSITYIIKAIGPGGSSVYSTNLAVIKELPLPEIELSIVPDSIKAGEKAKIIWNTLNANKVIIEGIGTVELSGSKEISPEQSTTYALKATGAGGEMTKGVHIKVKPKPPVIERKFILKGINFESGSATISYESYKILDEVVESLYAYPEAQIEIRGYTDNTGSRSTNMRLSQQRAESVLFYLIGKGIPAFRLRALGFGPDNPIAPNNTAEGRSLNRRIEMVRID